MNIITFMNKSYDNSCRYPDCGPFNNDNPWFITNVMTCITVVIGLPLTLVAIYGFYSQARNNEVAPIYIINLLISDLIQFCCLIVDVVRPKDQAIINVFFYIYIYALFTSICFMLCISMERYLVVAWPLWYHFRRNIKTSAVICTLAWVFPVVFVLCLHFRANFDIINITCIVFFLLPFPLFIFFLIGTCKALSTSSVPSDEKRRILATLFLVMFIYMMLFLPRIISYLRRNVIPDITWNLALIFIRLSPLADLFLYVFSRKGAVDKLLSSLCCFRVDSNDIFTSADQQDIKNNVNISTVEREM